MPTQSETAVKPVRGDIKQAALWMREGKRVRQASRSEMAHLYLSQPFRGSDRVCIASHGCEQYIERALTIDELLAEDWEIAND